MLDHGDNVIIGSAGDTALMMTDYLRVLKHHQDDYRVITTMGFRETQSADYVFRLITNETTVFFSG